MPTHSDLVARAVTWLRNYHKCSLVFAEMTTTAPETPDAIGWRSGRSRVVECKVSRADFLKELRTKSGALYDTMGMGLQRWYLVPSGLVRTEEVPPWCGLAYAQSRKVVVVKEAPDRTQWDFHSETHMLTSAIRRMELGSLFNRKDARWESYRSRVERQRVEGNSI